MNEQEQTPNKKFRINAHIVILGIIACIVIYAVIKLAIWNKGTEIEYDPNAYNPESEVEALDNIIPLDPKHREGYADDGVTTVVCFGNAPFYDEKDSDTGILNMVAEKTGATIYNLSAPDTTMSALNGAYTHSYPVDAFSFYWLTAAFCVNNTTLLEESLDNMGDERELYAPILSTIEELDFDHVDVIAIMYDASDYYEVRPTYNSDNPTSIQHFCGAMEAGIELIQQTYPHIRIIVMSPTYAYAVNDNGEYEDSDLTDYGMGPLATYVITQSNSAYTRLVSFSDCFYGGVHADNAKEYLEDNIKLNEKGRKLIAEKLAYAIERY